jgi:hypothetical protein
MLNFYKMSKSLDPTAEATVEGEIEKGNVSNTHVPHPPSYHTL